MKITANKYRSICGRLCQLCVTGLFAGILGLQTQAQAADKALLDILLDNGAITAEQYEQLLAKPELSSADVLGGGAESESSPATAADSPEPGSAAGLDPAITAEIDRAIDEKLPVKASYTDKGFRLETRDGRFQTNLQWRAQWRYNSIEGPDPRQVRNFTDPRTSNFEARRLRMKIGGYGYQPWLKYYFEVDLQPSREVDDDSADGSARVFDWRIDITKWDWASLRVGQWKIDLNRERVDSSGRQQFVERSIVNRIFTIDRQVGIQLRGRVLKDTPAEFRYYVGAFNGEGRGVANPDGNAMWMGRLQWNFLGRDLEWRQTDVEYTELPTGSLAFAGSTNTGKCTRWSSEGCGNLDGFTPVGSADPDQFKVDQTVQELAFKWRGFSLQQEYHRKIVADRTQLTKNSLTGGYIQSGYFFHYLLEPVPKPLELAMRYAFVDEPNATDRNLENERNEFSLVANWFFSGHNNKLTLDYSYLTLNDRFLNQREAENRMRLQWDISF
ncbi:MAG: porin [Gammaproteobacteria bacterium]|jgi:phosphate-selective porin|nr:porin [Gammaproteobacteria bacterium]